MKALFERLLGRRPALVSLRPTGGEIAAHLFENPRTGVARNVFWNLRIDCEPVHLRGVGAFEPDAFRRRPGHDGSRRQCVWRVAEAVTVRGGVFTVGDEAYAYWNDVRGLSSTASRDAYTQPGRNVSLSLTYDF